MARKITGSNIPVKKKVYRRKVCWPAAVFAAEKDKMVDKPEKREQILNKF